MKRLLIAAFALASVCQADETVASASVAGADKVAQIRQVWDDGNRKEALREVKKWKKTDSASPWPWVAAANLSFQQEKYGRCVSMADGALKRDPHSAEGFFWRGMGLEKKGKPLEAANEFQAALEADPGHSGAREALARVRVDLGETSASLGTN